MKPPTLVGIIERRLLINYRVDPEAVWTLLPAIFRPQLVEGSAVAGICLLRLGSLRPRGAPKWVGLRSENAAHRIAVEWDTANGIATGVYIPRRDSASLVNVLIGGRMFPGAHHRASFAIEESDERFSVRFMSRDGSTAVSLNATVSDQLRGSRLFRDLDTASRFFEQGSLGYSATTDPLTLDGLQLRTSAWKVEPLELGTVRSSFSDGGSALDPDSAELDCGLVMRHVPVTWVSADPVRVVTQHRLPA
jgi:hypothetical protein